MDGRTKKMMLVPYGDFVDLRDRLLAQTRDAETDKTISIDKQLEKVQEQPIPDDIKYRNFQALYSDFVNQIKKSDYDHIPRNPSCPTVVLNPQAAALPPVTLEDKLLSHVHLDRT